MTRYLPMSRAKVKAEERMLLSKAVQLNGSLRVRRTVIDWHKVERFQNAFPITTLGRTIFSIQND